MLGVYCPTYRRPDKLQSVADNLKSATKGEFKLYWGVEPHDASSIQAAKETGHCVVVNSGKQGYADTVQSIYEASDEPIFFCANDDFYFTDGWNVAPLEYLKDHPEIMVLGVHDGNEKTDYWTVFFIRREYIEEMSGVVDMPNRVFFPYNHNYTDTEFSQTAMKRGVWAKLETPCIEHRRYAHDETYEKNGATFTTDGAVYGQRRHLFC